MKLSLTSGKNTYTADFGGDDPHAKELVDAFVGLCVCDTYLPDTIINAMIEYLADRDIEVIDRKNC